MRLPLVAALLPLALGCADAAVPADQKRIRIDALYEGYRAHFPQVDQVTVTELVEELDGDDPPLLVDVRTPEERAVSMIPGAISVGDFEARRAELAGRPVVTYCTIGYRSGLYADELRRQGWEVRNLRGSILAWTHSERPLERNGESSRTVHVYGARWDLAADSFEVVW